MSTSSTPAAHAAIVNHIIEAIDRNSEKELQIALLIRDAIGDIARHITHRFVRSLASNLRELDPDMEPLEGDLTADRYCDIGWRHSTWPKGVSIRLEFQSPNYRGPSFGVCAPNDATLKATDDETRTHYVRISQELRQRIASAVQGCSSSVGKGKPSGWWPIYTDLPPPLTEWLTPEALPIVAGIKRHEGMTLVEWMSREFVEVRNALRPVLG